MADKKEITLEDAKRGRFLLRFVFAIIAFVIPAVITAFKLNVFTKEYGYKAPIVGLLVILVIFWRFKNRLFEWINKWEDTNIFKHILIGFSRVWVFVIIIAVLSIALANTSQTAIDIIFCLEWTAVCELVAYLLVYPFEMKLDYLVKRMIRKNERKADYKEAIKEMKEEENN